MHGYRVVFLLCFVGCSRCLEEKLQYSLFEGSSSKEFVKNVGADSGVVVPDPQYSFDENEAGHNTLFDLDNGTGILTVNGSIDRESVCPEESDCPINLEINVVSSDNVHYELIQVIVTILDINDNSPHFESEEHELGIMENAAIGAKFRLPKAVDLDSPANGVKGYSLLNPVRQFTLETEGSASSDLYPVLVLEYQLDREVLDFIQLDLVAFDSTNASDANTAQVKVTVTVQDVNDNPPEFKESEYFLTLDEDHEVMSTLVTVEATDPDFEDNGALVYSFDDTTHNEYSYLFSIDRSSGDLVLLGNLDYEDAPQIELVVLATEKNPSNMPAHSKVVITVVDVNDNKPVITLFTSTPDIEDYLSIKENVQAGAFLARLKATDRDSGPNGAVTCEIDTLHPDVFLLESLSSNNYKLTTNKSLDRELQANYSVVFLCRDGGSSPRLETRLAKLVLVEDENDNSPVLIKSNFSFTLHENNPVGTQLLQLQASDPDSGLNGEVKYTLVSAPTHYISIHPRSGSITTLVAFDYERDPAITFLVAAADQGEHSRTTTAIIEINILDTNDEPPVFLATHYDFQVYENLKLGAEVGQVTANDPDSAPYSEHYFTFVSGGSYNNVFAIEPSSGNIYTRTSFDREVKDIYELQIKAYDKLDPLLFSLINATVTISDQNDHPPVIVYPKEDNNTVHIGPVPNNIDQPLLQILALDEDIGENAILDYLLDPEGSDVFLLDQTTGYLYVKDTERLYDRAEYTLDIKVQDQGETPLFAMTQVLVQVEVDPEVLATNTVIIITVGVISGVVVSSLIISIALILFKRKAKQDKEKQLGYPGKHYTVKPVEGDVAADNVSELSATVLNNSQQMGNGDSQRDTSLEIRTAQNPGYDPMTFDFTEGKDKLSETSNSDSGLGSYEDSRPVIHRLSPNDGFPTKPTCKPSPTDSAYGTDSILQKQKKDPESLYPNHQQHFVHTRNGEVGVQYPAVMRNEHLNYPVMNCKVQGNNHHNFRNSSSIHKLTSEGNVGRDDTKNMFREDRDNFRNSSSDGQIHSRNPSPVRKVHHAKQNSETDSYGNNIASACSTPSKVNFKPAVVPSQRSNSTGPFDRHPRYRDNVYPMSDTKSNQQPSHHNAHKQSPTGDPNQKPPLSPRKSRRSQDVHPEDKSRRHYSTDDNMNNVAGHEVGIYDPEQTSKSPSKPKKHSKRGTEKTAGNSRSGRKRTASTGVDCSRTFHSPGVSAGQVNKTPDSSQYLNRYPRDNTGSSVSGNSENTQNSCELGSSSSPLTQNPAADVRSREYYREEGGEESLV